MPTSTTHYGLGKPITGETDWTTTLNSTIDQIDTAVAVVASSVTPINPLTAFSSGIINGTNTVFSFSHSPTFLIVALNGVIQSSSVDYSILNSTITFNNAPQIGDVLYVQGF